MRGWLATNPTGGSAQAGEGGDQLPGPPRPQLPELAVVAQGRGPRPGRRRWPPCGRGSRARNSGVGRSTESLTGAGGGTRRCCEGRYSREFGRRRRPRRRTAPRTTHSGGVDAAPPSWLIPTSIPVNSATICGPETKATASELMTTRSERPSRSAGPETTGPVAAAMTGTWPLQRGDGRGGASPAVQGGHAVEHVGPARRDEEDQRDAELTGLVGRFGQPHTVGVGDGAAPQGTERPGNDRIAPADPPDLRRDGADDALADGGRLLYSGHQDRM